MSLDFDPAKSRLLPFIKSNESFEKHVRTTTILHNINSIQYNSKHDWDEYWIDFWDAAFFIRPNLQLDEQLHYVAYPDRTRIDCVVNLKNQPPSRFWSLKGRAAAKDCLATLTVTGKGFQTQDRLLWLIVDRGFHNSTRLDILFNENAPIIPFVINRDKEEPNNPDKVTIIIPTFPSEELGRWSGPLVPPGQYKIELKITRQWMTSPMSKEYQITLPDDALEFARSINA